MSAQTTHPGEISLAKLLATLTATLHPQTYVFAVVACESQLPPFSEVEMFFREAKAEGITVITTQEYAGSHGLEYSFPCRKITLDVTSSLDAVGFIAVVATRLAAAGMGVNPVSGFYHDHLFIPLGKEEEAFRVIAELAEEKRQESQNAPSIT
ncbi:hypothetical protein QM012_002983 [Aureobasidium pullulans]|uniref:DUF2241 domain-containing protein n=1 Tax=Aureobasidium pullulans TaxID=5580 RepID=A0ABR0T8Y4_AURPU